MSDHNIEDGINRVELGSWREFERFIRDEHANCPAFIYRGEAHAGWPTESVLDRMEREKPTKKNYYTRTPDSFQSPPASRRQQFRAFQEAARGKLGTVPLDTLDTDDWWALARHHGLGTPLLDWTYSPYVALFFAFEDKKCLVDDKLMEPELRAVMAVSWHLVSDGPPPPDSLSYESQNEAVPKVYTPLADTSQRILAQQGVLMLMPKGCELQAHVRERFKDEANRAVLTKITMPNDDRIDCLKQLNKKNINRMTLFPDLDGAAAHVNALWERDFDSGLGQLPENTDYVKPPTV